MNSLLLNRIALVLELVAGFMLAPELIGEHRINKLHQTLTFITSSIAARLSGIYKVIKEYREVFSRPSYAVFFAVALLVWVFLVVREFQVYRLSPSDFIAYLALISIASIILEYFSLRIWTYDKIQGKARKLSSRLRSRFLAESIQASVMAEIIAIEFLLIVGAIPILLFIMLVVLILFGISLLARYISGRLLESNFRYTLIKIGGFLFVLKILLQRLIL